MADTNANPSTTWDDDVREDCEDDAWGLSTQRGGGCGPVPYKLVDIDGVYTLTDIDQNYIIEFQGDGLEHVFIGAGTDTYVNQETTLVSSNAFLLHAGVGVTINNIPGPSEWVVGPLADGVVMKKVGPNIWLALGDAGRI